MTAAALWFLPFSLQGLAMALDEFGFHRRRALPRLEWLGHLLDTSLFLACLACPLLLRPEPAHLRLFGLLALLSCLLITKDEFLHQRLCTGGEHWIHAVLFILHPLVLVASGLLWISLGSSALLGLTIPSGTLVQSMFLLQVLLVSGFLVFQILHGAVRGPWTAEGPRIDNGIYDALGEGWYSAQANPVALLRAESRLRTSWILLELQAHFGKRPLDVLDVACGAGFLAIPLAEEGHQVTGIDLSGDSLDVARRHDPTHSVTFLHMDARALSFPDAHFDVVCMMDFLEHLPERDEVLREASRVLRPGGWLFFHTFNRTPLAWLIAIKGVEWAVRNTPRHMHVYHLFLRPSELVELCLHHHLAVEVLRGVRPRIFTWAFLRLLITGSVSDQFRFQFTRSQAIGYCGRASKFADPGTHSPHQGHDLDQTGGLP
jgi:2-polyprenyl-6-hydroxyphenyl methylase/3-demethylubiquinone-9 3-methyltransferase